MKNVILFTVLLMLCTSTGTVLIYQQMNVNGGDAICIAGMISGFVLAFMMIKINGNRWFMPAFISALIITVPLLVISFTTANQMDTFTDKVWPLSITFSIMAGAITGTRVHTRNA